ncbi:MAG: hypothetical protein ACQESR_03265 [Planctomycetota bacterium]
MESCPAQAVLPLVGLAADKITRERCIWDPLTRLLIPTAGGSCMGPVVPIEAVARQRSPNVHGVIIANRRVRNPCSWMYRQLATRSGVV